MLPRHQVRLLWEDERLAVPVIAFASHRPRTARAELRIDKLDFTIARGGQPWSGPKLPLSSRQSGGHRKE